MSPGVNFLELEKLSLHDLRQKAWQVWGRKNLFWWFLLVRWDRLTIYHCCFDILVSYQSEDH